MSRALPCEKVFVRNLKYKGESGLPISSPAHILIVCESKKSRSRYLGITYKSVDEAMGIEAKLKTDPNMHSTIIRFNNTIIIPPSPGAQATNPFGIYIAKNGELALTGLNPDQRAATWNDFMFKIFTFEYEENRVYFSYFSNSFPEYKSDEVTPKSDKVTSTVQQKLPENFKRYPMMKNGKPVLGYSLIVDKSNKSTSLEITLEGNTTIIPASKGPGSSGVFISQLDEVSIAFNCEWEKWRNADVLKLSQFDVREDRHAKDNSQTMYFTPGVCPQFIIDSAIDRIAVYHQENLHRPANAYVYAVLQILLQDRYTLQQKFQALHVSVFKMGLRDAFGEELRKKISPKFGWKYIEEQVKDAEDISPEISNIMASGGMGMGTPAMLSTSSKWQYVPSKTLSEHSWLINEIIASALQCINTLASRPEKNPFAKSFFELLNSKVSNGYKLLALNLIFCLHSQEKYEGLINSTLFRAEFPRHNMGNINELELKTALTNGAHCLNRNQEKSIAVLAESYAKEEEYSLAEQQNCILQTLRKSPDAYQYSDLSDSDMKVYYQQFVVSIKEENVGQQHNTPSPVQQKLSENIGQQHNENRLFNGNGSEKQKVIEQAYNSLINQACPCATSLSKMLNARKVSEDCKIFVLDALIYSTDKQYMGKPPQWPISVKTWIEGLKFGEKRKIVTLAQQHANNNKIKLREIQNRFIEAINHDSDHFLEYVVENQPLVEPSLRHYRIS